MTDKPLLDPIITSTQPTYFVTGAPMEQPASNGPPIGKWRDGICDCLTNLWPSCGCALFPYGIWIMSQMSEKTGYASFKSIIVPFLLIWFVCFIISFFFPWVYILPGICALILGLFLRFHLVRKYDVNTNGNIVECLIGFFCFPCSVAQMARHVYGYRKVFDGDSDPVRPDHYNDSPV